jgi:hypothetical protein
VVVAVEKNIKNKPTNRKSVGLKSQLDDVQCCVDWSDKIKKKRKGEICSAKR